VNHTYAGKPHTVHLNLVHEYAKQFIHLLSTEEALLPLLPMVYLHDVIEDCRKTYNDMKETFGEAVAEAVYALTNEKGRNRKERANNAYHADLRNNRAAWFIQICDRLASW
jgi:(p)ppGpp synthase/HD superfamily hydrolase